MVTTMIRWTDVNEKDWFFHEVMEASNVILEDGEPLIVSIPYNQFATDAPYLYEEQKGVKGKKLFALTKNVIPTKANPLFVYIDGVQTMYKSCTTNAAGTSDVTFYAPPPEKSLVSFLIAGKPTADRFGKPSSSGATTYPAGKLEHGDTYYFDPLSRQFEEYLYAFGRQLRRVDVPDQEWTIQPGQDVAAKYIGTKNDRYVVSPASVGGYIYVPYNLDGVSVQFTYNSLEDDVIVKRGGTAIYHGQNVLFNNRFFPAANITRSEAHLFVDKLRRHYYSRFADVDAPTNVIDETITTYDGQRAINLNGRINVNGSGVVVMLDGVAKTKDTDFTIINDHAILWTVPLVAGRTVHVTFTKNVSERFADVGVAANMYDTTTTEIVSLQGTSSWWTAPVLAMENEVLEDGEYLVTGYAITGFLNGGVTVDHMYNPIAGTYDPVQHFMSRTIMTRAESVALLNRFRKWCIEKFK